MAAQRRRRLCGGGVRVIHAIRFALKTCDIAPYLVGKVGLTGGASQRLRLSGLDACLFNLGT
jgi:hypothetical protein